MAEVAQGVLKDRMDRVLNNLRWLVVDAIPGRLSPRNYRLIWMYSLHLNVLANQLSQGRLGWSARVFVEWLEDAYRFGDITPSRLKDKTLEIFGKGEYQEGLAEPWWADRVLVMDDHHHGDWELLFGHASTDLRFVAGSASQVLRAARLARPHMIMLNGDLLATQIPEMVAAMRDDQRLQGSSIWVYGDHLDKVDANHWAILDGRLDFPYDASAPIHLRHAQADMRRLRDLMMIDLATGLFSFGYLHRLLTAELLRSQRRSERLVLISFTFNPCLWLEDWWWQSNEGADHTIEAVAELLKGAVRGSDVVAFDGTGRFYVLIVDGAPSYLQRRVDEISQQISQEIAPTGWKGGYSALLSGVARYPQHGQMAEDILGHCHRSLWVNALSPHFSTA